MERWINKIVQQLPHKAPSWVRMDCLWYERHLILYAPFAFLISSRHTPQNMFHLHCFWLEWSKLFVNTLLQKSENIHSQTESSRSMNSKITSKLSSPVVFGRPCLSTALMVNDSFGHTVPIRHSPVPYAKQAFGSAVPEHYTSVSKYIIYNMKFIFTYLGWCLGDRPGLLSSLSGRRQEVGIEVLRIGRGRVVGYPSWPIW